MPETPRRLNLILDTITDGILVVDARGIVLYANQSALQLLERPKLIGESLAIPVVTERNAHQDINLIRPSGFAWAELRSAPIEWEGEAAYVIGLRDINDRKQAEIALQESQALFKTLANVAPVGIFRTNRQGECEYVNKRWCEISGLSAAQALGSGWVDSIFAPDRAQIMADWQASVALGQPFTSQYRFQHSDGTNRWVIGRAEAELDQNGVLLGYVGTITDITDIKETEQSLKQAAVVFETTREGVMITDAERNIIMVNRAFTQITGYSPEDAVGQRPSLLRSGRHGSDFYAAMWREINDHDHWQGEIWNRRKTGEIYPELLSISIVRNQAGEISHYVGVFADITKLKASEMELEFLAHHDPLTKLPNRMLLLSRLQHCLDLAQRAHTKVAVLLLDLDRFKDVNDSFGHLAGDDLLQLVAARLSSRLRSRDTVCRLGGDEFVVLLEELTQVEAAARVATEIITALSSVWRLSSGHEVRIGVSVGIALFPEHGTNGEELIRHADTALYQAKSAGRNCYRYFSDELTQVARERIAIETRLRQSVAQNELRLFFQPLVCIMSGRIIGAEALVRWQFDDQLLPPARFIPIAEETGLIGAIGSWVLGETCRLGRQWLDAGYPPLRLAVNLSSQQFLHSDIGNVVAEVLSNSGFPAEYLELELTESTLMKREKEAVTILRQLHELGVNLTIDDFGTGYSSLAYLRAFPLDALKIDQRFIQDMSIQQNGQTVSATIVAMAHALGLRVVAEGVENALQLNFLQSLGCELCQGFLISPALPAVEFECFIRDHASDTAD